MVRSWGMGSRRGSPRCSRCCAGDRRRGRDALARGRRPACGLGAHLRRGRHRAGHRPAGHGRGPAAGPVPRGVRPRGAHAALDGPGLGRDARRRRRAGRPGPRLAAPAARRPRSAHGAHLRRRADGRAAARAARARPPARVGLGAGRGAGRPRRRSAGWAAPSRWSSTRHCCVGSARPLARRGGQPAAARQTPGGAPGRVLGRAPGGARRRSGRGRGVPGTCSSRSTSTPTGPASRSASTWPGRWPPRTAAPSVRTRPTTAPCSGCGSRPPGTDRPRKSAGAPPLGSAVVSDIDIREVDRTDEAQLHAWWSAGHEAMSQRPVDLWPDWEISRLSLPEVDPDSRVGPARRVTSAMRWSAARSPYEPHQGQHRTSESIEVYVPARRIGAEVSAAPCWSTPSRSSSRTAASDAARRAYAPRSRRTATTAGGPRPAATPSQRRRREGRRPPAATADLLPGLEAQRGGAAGRATRLVLVDRPGARGAPRVARRSA